MHPVWVSSFQSMVLNNRFPAELWKSENSSQQKAEAELKIQNKLLHAGTLFAFLVLKEFELSHRKVV